MLNKKPTPASDSSRVRTPLQKRNLLKAVATQSHLSYTTVELVYDALLTVIIENIRTGREVQLTGFGKFYPQFRKGGAPIKTATLGVKGFSSARNTNRAPAKKQMRFAASRQSKAFLELSSNEVVRTRVPGTRINDERIVE